MHKKLTQREQKDVLRELKKVGFGTKQEILSAVDDLGFIRLFAAEKSGMLNIELEDPKDIRFLFHLERQTLNGPYTLKYVLAMMRYGTELNEAGVNLVSKRYELSPGNLPQRGKMTDELVLRVEDVKRRERVHTDRNLEQDFMHMGFYDFREMLKTASHHANLTYLRTHEPAEIPCGNGNEKFEFEFIVVSPAGDLKPFINLVKASLSTKGVHALEIQKNTARTFYPINGVLPNKEFMTNRILTNLELKGDLFDRIKTVFNMGSGEMDIDMKNPKLFQRRVY